MGFKEASLAERQDAAAKARKAALENFRNKVAANDANFPQRQQALKAARQARETRAAEREATRAQRESEKAAQAEREQEARLAAERESKARSAREKAEKAEREIALQAEGKAARDKRYAARKARK